MKKILLIILILSSLFEIGAKTPYDEVENPSITSISQDGREITISFNLVTGSDGFDRGTINILKDGELINSRAIGRSKDANRSADFTLSESGEYEITLTGERRGEKEKKNSEVYHYSFLLPLETPTFTLRNLSGGKIELSFTPVQEAERYIAKAYDGDVLIGELESLSSPVVFENLDIGTTYTFTLSAIRGEEEKTSNAIDKTAREDAERIWNFAYFGQSTKESLNYYQIIDSDNLTLKLYSTKFDEAGNTTEKGGKFTAFHDGISYYYTEYDPYNENFELSATFIIDYINPTADGQEGFGIVAMDSLGENTVSSVNHYTNSASIIATKFEETINGSKKTSKDTLGARFLTGLTEEIINSGDDAIAENGKAVSHAFSYASSDLVKKGDVYRITLKKDNTGYHALFSPEIASEDTVTEYILYGPEKLEVIDKEKSYVGLAVARGCNVTVTDITFKVTDPKTDPEALEEPDELIPLIAKVDSPSSYFEEDYPFVFTSNADGKIRITDSMRRVIADNETVKANVDYKKEIKIKKGINDYSVTFTPDPEYRPAEKQTIAQYDRRDECYKENYNPINITLSIVYLSYEGEKIYASPSGNIFGRGTKESPVDIKSALSFSRPGQTVVLQSGEWNLLEGIKIDRGNSGKEGQMKRLVAEGDPAILNFEYAPSGFVIWGDYWNVENIHITKTADNIKGLQVAGDYNIIRNVEAYFCGDTGIQISGVSSEPYEKWPHDNLIESAISHDNRDSAENNADGFAAKLTVGDGNIFRSCIAYSNIDDGWDLYSKVETGPIGKVRIENSVAYKNGSLSDGRGKGDGNGFKLGGDGIAIAHELVNSIAYSNGNAGVTSNSNPSVVLENITSCFNGSENITLYGKGKGERFFKAENVLSLEGNSSDNISECPSLIKESNFFFDGARSVNSLGEVLSTSLFKTADTSIHPNIDENGNVDMKGLFEITDPSIHAGARL